MNINQSIIKKIKYNFTITNKTNDIIENIDNKKLNEIIELNCNSIENYLNDFITQLQVVIPGNKYKFKDVITTKIKIPKLSISNIIRKKLKKTLKEEEKEIKINLSICFNVLYPENCKEIMHENKIHVAELNNYKYLINEKEIIKEYKDLLYTRMFVDKAFKTEIEKIEINYT